eukprot:COSAG02_NODE_497_length_21092_cov_43.948650_6_plen_134_part_00
MAVSHACCTVRTTWAIELTRASSDLASLRASAKRFISDSTTDVSSEQLKVLTKRGCPRQYCSGCEPWEHRQENAPSGQDAPYATRGLTAVHVLARDCSDVILMQEMVARKPQALNERAGIRRFFMFLNSFLVV